MSGRYKGRSPSLFQPLHDRLDQLIYGRPRRELPSDQKKRKRRRPKTQKKR